MSLDFDTKLIKIKSDADQWGPFRFSFTSAIPSGTSISSATVTSSLNGSDTTSSLIESGSVSNGSDYVDLKLQYPGSSFIGMHKLRFKLTLNTSAIQDFDFGYVSVEE